MLKSIKISLKDTLIYGFGNIAVKVVGLILIPLYTDPKYFSIDEFGILGILEISALVLTASMASALPQSLTRWFWDKEYKDNQKGIFFMTFATQVIVSVAFCLLLIPLSGKISVLIFSKIDWSRVITLVILASGIQAINNIINTLMRLQSKSLLYTITNLFKLSSVLGLTLFFILSKKMGLEGIYLAQVIGNSLVVLFLLAYTLKNSKVFFDKVIFKSMNAYGFPLFLANISAVMLNVIDRYSLNSLALLKSVALYTLAFKITSVLKLVIVDSMKLALGPMMFKRLDTPDNKRFYSKVLLYSSFVMMFAIVGVSLFSFELTKVMTKSKEFWGAVVIVPILAMSIFFINLKDFSVYGLHFAKKTRIIGSIVVISTILSLLLNIIFIPIWGITGAAVATLLSQFIYWLACYYFSQKVFFIPYEIRKITIMFLCGAALSFSSLLINGMDLLPRMVIKIICLGSFPFILYLFNFYEPVELQSIRGFINKWSNIKNLKSNLSSLRGITDEL
ncbi:MAG TPA: polysaccharide biosynthesis C-terminal domain-containing protein [Bacteroidales bacterium]